MAGLHSQILRKETRPRKDAIRLARALPCPTCSELGPELWQGTVLLFTSKDLSDCSGEPWLWQERISALTGEPRKAET